MSIDSGSQPADAGSNGLATGTARLLNGATPASTAALTTPSPTPAGGVQYWLVSPDQVEVTITGIGWDGPEADPWFSPLEDCVVTYDRAAGTLASLADCGFDVAPGTYTSVRVEFSRTTTVLVDDAVNGIYTDPSSGTGWSTTAPTGGAQPIDNTVDFGGSSAIFFAAPLEITADDTPSIDVVLHGLHTIALQRTATGEESLRYPSEPLAIVPSLSGVGGAAFYSSAATAENVDVSATPPAELVVFYDVDGPTQTWVTYTGGVELCAPAGVPGGAMAASPESSPEGGDGGRAGGYLGIDSTDTICWALATSDTYTTYASLWSMPQASAVGATTTVTCLATDTVPAPTSGDTYASGCPAIDTPTNQVSVTLLAD